MDGTLCVWDLENGSELFLLEGRQDRVISRISAADMRTKIFEIQLGERVYGIALLPDEKKVISGHADGTIRLWNLGNKTEILRFRGPEGTVKAVAVLLDGRQAISCGSDRTLRLWDLENISQLETV